MIFPWNGIFICTSANAPDGTMTPVPRGDWATRYNCRSFTEACERALADQAFADSVRTSTK